MTEEEWAAEWAGRWIAPHRTRVGIVEPDWWLRLQCGQVLEVPAPVSDKGRRARVEAARIRRNPRV